MRLTAATQTPNPARAGQVPGGGRSSPGRHQARNGASATSATATLASASRTGGTPRSKAYLASTAAIAQQAPASTTLNRASTTALRSGRVSARMPQG